MVHVLGSLGQSVRWCNGGACTAGSASHGHSAGMLRGSPKTQSFWPIFVLFGRCKMQSNRISRFSCDNCIQLLSRYAFDGIWFKSKIRCWKTTIDQNMLQNLLPAVVPLQADATGATRRRRSDSHMFSLTLESRDCEALWDIVRHCETESVTKLLLKRVQVQQSDHQPFWSCQGYLSHLQAQAPVGSASLKQSRKHAYPGRLMPFLSFRTKQSFDRRTSGGRLCRKDRSKEHCSRSELSELLFAKSFLKGFVTGHGRTQVGDVAKVRVSWARHPRSRLHLRLQAIPTLGSMRPAGNLRQT